jgi:uncharacterized membrane protein
MKFKLFKLIIISLLFFSLFSSHVLAEDINHHNIVIPQQKYHQAKVLELLEEKEETVSDDYTLKIQILSIEITSGDKKGTVATIQNEGIASLDRFRSLKEGDRIVIVENINEEEGEYFFYDHNRFSPLIIILILFALFVIYIGRKRGLGALLGLVFSIFILVYFIIPQIITGANPIYVTLVGSFFIATGSLFLSHGFNRRTILTWFSTITTLLIAVGLSTLLIDYLSLFGMGSEEAIYLSIGEYSGINLKGLLLSAMVIGTLGVLDDVTATQTVIVWELKKANLNLKWKELYHRSLIVGREHIASLVNTLALAYAGAALPLFILLYTNKLIPFWLKINSEPIAEEIVRTILGSTALILAVPISSFFAAYFISKMKISEK